MKNANELREEIKKFERAIKMQELHIQGAVPFRPVTAFDYCELMGLCVAHIGALEFIAEGAGKEESLGQTRTTRVEKLLVCLAAAGCLLGLLAVIYH